MAANVAREVKIFHMATCIHATWHTHVHLRARMWARVRVVVEASLLGYSLNPLMISLYKPIILHLFLSCGTMFVYFIA